LIVAEKKLKELRLWDKKGRPDSIKVGILFPIPYRAAIASLTLHLLHHLVDSFEYAVAYRYFYNSDEDVLIAADGLTDLYKLDIILVSASFELDYITVARILEELKLLRNSKRARKPYVFVGGIAPTANPLPLVDLVDGVVIGEAEPVIRQIIESAIEEDVNKPTCVLTAEKIDAGERVRKCYVEDLDSVPYPMMQTVPLDEEPIYGWGFRLELSRGCPRMCAFCMEGHVMNPFRFRSFTTIKGIISRVAEVAEVYRKRFVLYSLSLFDIPYSDGLLNALIDLGFEASIPSLRPDSLTEERIRAIKMLRQRVVTIAPETLSDRVGCWIGKCPKSYNLADILLAGINEGVDHFKMYLIAGFGREADKESFESLKKIFEYSFERRKPPKKPYVRVTVNPLVPKPWTPFQYLPAEWPLRVAESVEMFKKLKSPYVEVEITKPEWAFLQALISLGDRQISTFLVELSRRDLRARTVMDLYRRLVEKGVMRYAVQGYSEPPWFKYVDLSLPIQYFELRFKFLRDRIVGAL